MKKPFGIVIAEDYTLFREGIKALISSETDLKVVGEAEDGLEAIRSVREHSPDLVLIDLSMPRMTGFDAIKEIKRISPETKIIVVTVHNSEEYILATLQVGADGYVLKEARGSEAHDSHSSRLGWSAVPQPEHFRAYHRRPFAGEESLGHPIRMGNPDPTGEANPEAGCRRLQEQGHCRPSFYQCQDG